MGKIIIRPGVNFGPATPARVARKIIEIASYYPKADAPYVTSVWRRTEFDGGTWSHHNGTQSWRGRPTQAVDFGDYDDPEPNSQDQANMRDFAQWVQRSFGSETAELIHTTPYNTDNGFYITHGRRNDGFNGENAHLNHVHWALDEGATDRILAKLRQSKPPPPPPPRPTASKFLGMFYAQTKGSAEVYVSDGVQCRLMPTGTWTPIVKPMLDAGVPFLTFNTATEMFRACGRNLSA